MRNQSSIRWLLCFAILVTTAGQLIAEDAREEWIPVAPGVWQAEGTAPGSTRMRAHGAEGLAYMAAHLQEQLVRLDAQYRQEPSLDLARLIDDRTQLVEKLLDRLETGEASPSPKGLPPQPKGCFRTFDYATYAGSALCGSFATAWANYTTDCPEACHVYSSAQVDWTCGERSERVAKSCTDYGTNASCSSNTSQPFAGDPCGSLADASIYCPELDELHLWQYELNESCSGAGVCDC